MKKVKISMLGLIIAISFMCCKKDNGPAFQKVPGSDSTTTKGSDTATSKGSDTATTQGNLLTVSFDTADQIKITASRIDFSDTSTSLVFSAETISSYTCTSNSLSFLFTSDATSYDINYTGVSRGRDCTTGTSPASSVVYLNPATGTRTLNIKFKGITYSGTITKTGNKFTINWSYKSGVTISPTNL